MSGAEITDEWTSFFIDIGSISFYFIFNGFPLYPKLYTSDQIQKKKGFISEVEKDKVLIEIASPFVQSMFPVLREKCPHLSNVFASGTLTDYGFRF